MLRELMIEETDEYFSGLMMGIRPDLPAWLWFVFHDAGIGIEAIAHIIFSDADEAVVIGTNAQAVQQLNYANKEQIAAYAKARDAWLEMPGSY
jgi:hypothetical protein